MTRTERTREIKRAISPIKSQLIRLLGEMEREGLANEAKAFGGIIGRLEDFQNR
jgi:hypothetical protein